MVEAGIVVLIDTGISALSIPGGFAVQLPKNQISVTEPMAWTYRSIVSEEFYTLEGQDAYTEWEIQIDCHGYTMANSITLARAIQEVLRGGWSGVLSDPDHTRVFGIQQEPPSIDGFSDINRSYVRSLEYKIQYAQS